MLIHISTSVVADIGGTNARFSRVGPDGKLGPCIKLSTNQFSNPKSALKAFLKAEGGPMPKRLCLAIAGPIQGDQIKTTNASWSFSILRLQKELDLDQLEVINDFEALALSLPFLDLRDTQFIGKKANYPSTISPMAVLGPGTGLGMAGLLPVSNGWKPIPSEGGFASLAPLTQKEFAVCQIFQQRFGRVSAERVLSGPGLYELHKTLAALKDVDIEADTPEGIVGLAIGDGRSLSFETVDIFCNWLGDVAGNVALMYGAKKGVYLVGNIVLALSEILLSGGFRNRFEHKGRGSAFVAKIPTFIITAKNPALVGCIHRLGFGQK
jgi:glucokinase